MEIGGKVVVAGEEYCSEEDRELTVGKTMVFSPGDGFSVYDHQNGDLVFRVDTYALDEEIVLMDPFGTSILTVRKKWPSLHHRWEGFLGERKEGQDPLFSVKRSSIFGGERSGFIIQVHDGGEYRVEGSFAQRSCRVLYRVDAEGGDWEILAAEIKRKVDAHMVLGRDVFCLSLRAGFDAAFVVGLVLILNRTSNNDDNDDDHDSGCHREKKPKILC